MPMLAPIALVATASLVAAPVVAPRDGPERACELHVWPASEMKGYVGGSGGMAGGGLIGGLIGASRAKPVQRIPPIRALDPAQQLELLESANLPALLANPTLVVVRHAEAIPRLETTGVRQRHAPSVSPCYSELIVSQIFFDQAPMAEAELRSLFVYRVFDDQPVVKSSFSTWVATPLAEDPPTTQAEVDLAVRQFNVAFVSDLRAFIGLATRRKPAERQKS